MKNTLITTLKGKPILNGELLFDNYKISFRNNTDLFVINIVVLGIISIINGLNWHKHFYSNDLFDQIIYPLGFFMPALFLMFLIIKYPLAKKMNKAEFKPNDLKSVIVKKTIYGISFTFHLHNNSEQKFKCKQDRKSDKLIAFLKKSEVEIITV
jgi:hypothetical protein